LCVVALLVYLGDATDHLRPIEGCLEPPSTGECRAAIQAWHFDPETCSCKEYMFGGCQDSRNNFNSRERCIKRCQPATCLLPAVPGPCRAIIRQWYYNPDTNSCEQFNYGGCGGNENRFPSHRDCRRACGTASKKAARSTVPANDSGCMVPSRRSRSGPKRAGKRGHRQNQRSGDNSRSKNIFF